MKGFILFYLLFIFVVRSIDVTVLTDLKEFKKNQFNSNENYCKFSFEVLIHDDINTIKSIDLDPSLSNIIGPISITFPLFSEKDAIVKIDFSNVQFGEYETIKLLIIYSDPTYVELSKNYTLPKLTCSLIDSTKLNISIVGKLRIDDKFFNRPTGIIRIDGFNYSIPKLLNSIDSGYTISNYVNDSANIGSDYYIIIFANPSKTFPISGWNYSIEFYQSENKSINFEHAGIINYPYNLSLVSMNTDVISLMGTYAAPYVKIQTENKIFSLQYDDRQWSYIFPISGGGINKNITYISKVQTNYDIIKSPSDLTLKSKSVIVSSYDKDGKIKIKLDKSIDYYNFKLNTTLYSIGIDYSYLANGHLNFLIGVLDMSNMNLQLSRIYSMNDFDKSILQQPYGFTNGNLKKFTLSFSIPLPGSSAYSNQFTLSVETINLGVQSPLSNVTDLQPPSLLDYSLTYLYDNYVLLRFNFTDDISGLQKVVVDKVWNFYPKSIVNGTSTSGTFECVYQIQNLLPYPIISLQLFDMVNRYSNYIVGSYYKFPNGELKPFQVPNFFAPIVISNIQFIDFKYNNIDTTGSSYWNEMTVKLKNDSESLGDNSSISPLRVVFYFSNGIEFSGYDYDIYLQWDDVKKQWTGSFKMPANLLTGNVYYYIVTGGNYVLCQSFPEEWQLKVYSKDADLVGPIFSQIDKILPTEFEKLISFGWRFTIFDHANGFSHGYVVVKGALDNSMYNITLSSAKQPVDVYNVIIKLDNVTVTQTYRITEVVLVDYQNQISKFEQAELDQFNYNKPYINPFINFMDDPTINSIDVITKNVGTDGMITTLDTFKQESVVYDELTKTRTITYKISLNQQSRKLMIKKDQFPILYFSSALGLDETISTVCTLDNDTLNYIAVVEIPDGFSFPSDIYISLYNIINNAGQFNGYSSNDLITLGFTDHITSEKSASTIYIKSAILTNNNTQLIIFGVNFNNRISQIKIQRESTHYQIDTFSLISSTVIKIKFSGVVNSSPIYVSIKYDSNALETNNVSIIPIIPNFIQPSTYPTPSTTPIVTNPPQKCKGTPECGGPNQGYCQVGVGCICYSPFIGIECTSKIIIVTPPINDPTKPDTSIEVPAESNGNNITSIISIVALREINSVTNEQVTIYYLDKWIYTNISSSTSQYIANITTGSNNITTTVNATLEWFKDLKNITFANEQITMNPSSMKYTILLSSYGFKSKLNHLQVVLSAQIQSTEDDICSGKEFGDTTTDNSNYIKLQVSSNSFYGRFIKRGIVDDKITTISNELLDSKFNAIETENYAQSYIGIVIGNYENSVIIDPDWSLLLDSNPATSICPKSGLTKAQLVGIIVSGSVFFIVILIIIGKIIYSSPRCLPLKISIYKLLRKKKY